MLKTYFFIPVNNPKFINKVNSLQSDYFVFDFEDSISKNEIFKGLENINHLKINMNYFVRPNLYIDNSDKINAELIVQLVKIGFNNFLIPKFANLTQLEKLKQVFESTNQYEFDKFKFILLVEHPAGLLIIDQAISKKLLNIVSVGFGSHDYCNIMGMQHTLTNLMYARQAILNSAKANNLGAIDIVSTDLKNESGFCEEVFNGFSLGFDGKFIIHPRQLALLKEIKYYSQDEVDEAKEVYKEIVNMKNNEISIIKVNGRIFEKPHINRIIKIVNWSLNYDCK